MASEIFPQSGCGLAVANEAIPGLLVDAEGRVQWLSDGARRIFALEKGAVGAALGRLLPPELQVSASELLARAFERGEPVLGAPHTLPGPTGLRWVLLHAQPVLDGPSVTRTLMTLLDCGPDGITDPGPAAQKADPAVRALLTNDAFAIYRMSSDWTEMHVLRSKGFLRDTKGSNFRWLDDYIAPEDQPLVQATIAEAIRSKTAFELEHPIARADGSVGWSFSRAVPILDTQGEIVEWIGSASDVTERRRELEELAQAQRIEAIGRLAGGISQDFNNLLTIITANLELAEMRVSDPLTLLLIDRAARAAELSTDFNRRLLSLAGTRRPAPQRVDLARRIQDLAVILARALSERVTLSTDIAPDLWPVHADPGEIDSVLLNLALNARDAMPAGGRLRITACNRQLQAAAAQAIEGSRPGDFVCVTVQDTGIGMSPETLQRAKRAFFSTKAQVAGTGLGLFRVTSALREAQGFLNLASTPGKGTRVSFYLPRREEHPHGPGQSPHGFPRRAGDLILVVEAQPRLRQATCEQLETLGYRTLSAATPAEAQALLSPGSTIRLVVSELGHAGSRSGHDLARWVQAERPGVRVLLTSGEAPAASESEAGMPCLPKPYGIGALARAVRQALD